MGISLQRTVQEIHFILVVLALGFSLQIPTPQSDLGEGVAEDTKDEREEGEWLNSNPGVLGVPYPG